MMTRPTVPETSQLWDLTYKPKTKCDCKVLKFLSLKVLKRNLQIKICNYVENFYVNEFLPVPSCVVETRMTKQSAAVKRSRPNIGKSVEITKPSSLAYFGINMKANIVKSDRVNPKFRVACS